LCALLIIDFNPILLGKFIMKNVLLLITAVFVLSGCADAFRDYFKRSANNKLVDTRGFKGEKRKPLYNKKYINMAKRNVINENFDDDEYDDMEDEYYSEVKNPYRINREMYMQMLREDAAMRKKKARAKRHFDDDEFEDDYPSLPKASKKSQQQPSMNEEDLQKELSEIKSMLNDAKQDLAKYRCPAQVGNLKPKPAGTPKTEKKSSVKNTTEEKTSLKTKFLKEKDDFDDKVLSKPSSI
jgi:ribosomal protein L29